MATYKVPELAEAHARGLLEGRARGLSEGVLRILALRGISVDEGTRQKILACRDPELLERWQERAVQASSLADLENLERNG